MISINKIVKYLVFAVTISISPLAYSNDAILKDIEGEEHAVSDYIGKGKWTIINLWGTKCPPCREEMPDLVQFHDKHKDSDAIVVGIAIDFPSYGYAKKDEVSAFADDYLIDFPILLSNSKITQRLGLGRLEGLPTTFMYTPEGKLVGMQVGAVSKEILEKYINKYNKKK